MMLSEGNPGRAGTWFQAHDYVEEVPEVETWYGYAGTAAFLESPNKGFERWSYEKKTVFLPEPTN